MQQNIGFAVCLIFLGLPGNNARCQKAPMPLQDGQEVTLTGKLTPEPAGRLQFLAIRTNQPYVPVMRYDCSNHKVKRRKTSA